MVLRIFSGFTRAFLTSDIAAFPAPRDDYDGNGNVNDVVRLTVKNDEADFGAGNDTVRGLDGADILAGGLGDDTVSGDNGNDQLYGGAGADLIYGGADDDTLEGGAGADLLDGGEGVDTVRYTETVGVNLARGTASGTASGADRLKGIENVISGAGNDVLKGNNADNMLSGGGGKDTLTGEGGNDALKGGEGADMLEGGEGDDVLEGGGGIDTAMYDHSDFALTVNLMTGTAVSESEGADRLKGVENVTAGAGDDTLTGDKQANLLTAGAGDDTARGSDGDDVLKGGDGADKLSGDLGADRLFGEAGDDRLVVFGGETSSRLQGDFADGGEGMDTISYEKFFKPLRIDLGVESAVAQAGGAKDTLRNIEIVEGGAAGDLIIGDSGYNVLRGMAGNDVLDGAGDDDVLEGGAGNDVLKDSLGSDELYGGVGNDVFIMGPGNDDIDGGIGLGHANNNRDVISFEDLTSSVTVDFSRNIAYSALTGRDDLNHIEVAIGGEAGDNMISDSDSEIYGMGGDDRLENYSLEGYRSDIDGGAGDDVLVSEGEGMSYLTGGAGVDLFVFKYTSQLRGDVITDFSVNEVIKIDDGLTNPALTDVRITEVQGGLQVFVIDGYFFVMGDISLTADNFIFSG